MANNGEITAPCGVPISAFASPLSSIIFPFTLERLNVPPWIIDFLTGKDAEGSKKHYTHRDLLELKEAIDRFPEIKNSLFVDDECSEFSAQFPHQTKKADSIVRLISAFFSLNNKEDILVAGRRFELLTFGL